MFSILFNSFIKVGPFFVDKIIEINCHTLRNWDFVDKDLKAAIGKYWLRVDLE